MSDTLGVAPKGFHRTGDDPGLKVGDIVFTIGDIPVIIDEIAMFADGRNGAAAVHYIGIGYPHGTSGVESLGDLMTETHEEFTFRIAEDNYASLGTWHNARNIADVSEFEIRRIRGVATGKSIAEWHRTMARAFDRGDAL